MQYPAGPFADPSAYLARLRPDHPVLLFAPHVLEATARRFIAGFPGRVTYAVKANDRPEVLENLGAAGITAFDVASPAEMRAVRAANPAATLHYNNPVRLPYEIETGIALGVASWSVDEAGELEKLAAVPRSCEVAVRFALPVEGAAYHFGDKFGADPATAAALLRKVALEGWTPALSFHPGTQCENPEAWAACIEEAARIAGRAGVRIARLNVGGGFAADRHGMPQNLEEVFHAIARATARAFGPDAPQLICEPGRAMVAEAFTLATRIKAIRDDGRVVFLNDGIYGGLADLRDMGLTGRVRVVSPDGVARRGRPVPRVVFGPTCDSLDRLPDGLPLAEDTRAGDYVLFDGMGAYSVAMSTRFNGYGLSDVATVLRLTGH